jgi:hypothetical protein
VHLACISNNDLAATSSNLAATSYQLEAATSTRSELSRPIENCTGFVGLAHLFNGP